MCADSRSLGCNVKFVKKFGGEIHVIHMILLMFKNKKKTCHTQYCIVYFCKSLSVYNINIERRFGRVLTKLFTVVWWCALA